MGALGGFAGIAQLVERLLAMQKVAGSSPVARSGTIAGSVGRRALSGGL